MFALKRALEEYLKEREPPVHLGLWNCPTSYNGVRHCSMTWPRLMRKNTNSIRVYDFEPFAQRLTIGTGRARMALIGGWSKKAFPRQFVFCTHNAASFS